MVVAAVSPRFPRNWQVTDLRDFVPRMRGGYSRIQSLAVKAIQTKLLFGLCRKLRQLRTCRDKSLASGDGVHDQKLGEAVHALLKLSPIYSAQDLSILICQYFHSFIESLRLTAVFMV